MSLYVGDRLECTCILDGIRHTGLLTAWEQDPARKLSTNLYDLYHCCVYSELLTMDGGTVRNMLNFITRINFRN